MWSWKVRSCSLLRTLQASTTSFGAFVGALFSESVILQNREYRRCSGCKPDPWCEIVKRKGPSKWTDGWKRQISKNMCCRGLETVWIGLGVWVISTTLLAGRPGIPPQNEAELREAFEECRDGSPRGVSLRLTGLGCIGLRALKGSIRDLHGCYKVWKLIQGSEYLAIVPPAPEPYSS